MKRKAFLGAFIAVLLLSQSVQVFAQWTTPELVSEVISPYNEWASFMSSDDLTLYFTRGGTSTHYWNQLYQATRSTPSGPFSNVSIISELTCNEHETSPWVSSDNLRMYFARTWHIKISTRASIYDSWGTPLNITELNNIGQTANPKLSADELSIVFNKYFNNNTCVIYAASRSDREAPFNNIHVLSEIDTTNAVPTFLSKDGLVLYFVHNDDGTAHNYVSSRPSINDTFSTPQLLYYWPENYTLGCFRADGQTAYLGHNGEIYVSYAITNIYIDAAKGNNSNSGTSQANAVATIQRGIDLAPNGYKVLIYPGVYSGKVNFKGKAITLQGVADANGIPVLENLSDIAISFTGSEGSNSIIKNLVIRNSPVAISLQGSSPTISNITMVNNGYGIIAGQGAHPDVSNCIFWGSSLGDMLGCQARYSNTVDANSSRHNIYANPLFVDPNNGDYRLLSERGRFWPEHKVWVLDKVTSPCINAGDPNAAYSAEPAPNGERINMGAYGGTAYASMKEKPNPYPDVNEDGVVDASDLATLVDDWLEAAGWTQ